MKNLNQSTFIWLIGILSLTPLFFTACPQYTTHVPQYGEEWTLINPIDSLTSVKATRTDPYSGQTETITRTLAEVLSHLPVNSSATPYTLIVNVNNIEGLRDAIYNNEGKYIYLNLSGSTFTSIGSWTFSYCANLTSVIIPDSVDSIGEGAFFETAWFNNQPDGVVYAGKVAYVYKGTMPVNTSITLRDGTKGIADNAFYDCTSLASVTFQRADTAIISNSFPSGNSLQTAYTAGGAGTYTRESGEEEWAKSN